MNVKLRSALGLLLIPLALKAQNSAGSLSPSIAENTSCPFAYSSPTNYLPEINAFSSDDNYATAIHCDCCDMNTRCFETKAFGFNIPLTATIAGIKAEVEKKATSGSIVQDNGVMLLKGGIVVGVSQSQSSNWPSSDDYSTYGDETDLWGTTWTPAEINDSSFGLAFASISYTCFGNGTSVISYIDHIQITVYYNDISTGEISVASNEGIYLFPNPVTGEEVMISVPSMKNSVRISLTDLSGRLLEQKTTGIIDGRVNYSIRHPAGIYMILLENDHSAIRQKLVIQ